MGTTLTLTDIESMDRKDVLQAVQFLAGKIGYKDEAPADVVRGDTPENERNPEENLPLPGLNEEAEPEVVTPPAPPASQAGIDVDAEGLPWDGRIHATTRTKVADGTWKLRRGVSEELIAMVVNELRQTMGLPVSTTSLPPALSPAPTQAFAQVPPPPAPPAVQEVIPAPFVPDVVPPVAQTTTTPPVESLAGSATNIGATSLGEQITFPKLMQKITAAFAAKTLDQVTIQAACQAAGIPSLPMLASRPDLVPVVATTLGLAL